MNDVTTAPTAPVAPPLETGAPAPAITRPEISPAREESSPFGMRLRAWAAGITIADGLMVAIGAIAAVARFANLGGPLLSPGEAASALASWQFATTETMAASVASPAYFALTSLLVAVFGGSDLIVRFIPALAGTITALLPWLLRGRVRPFAYITAALFLAVSPLNVAISRTAGGDALALLAVLLLTLATLRWWQQGSRFWAAAAGVAAGLGLTSSPLFFSGLVSLVVAGWLVVRRSDWLVVSGNRQHWLAAALAGTATCVLLGASFLLYPAGLGAAFRLFPDWLREFGLPWTAQGGATLSPVLAALRYEPALLILGLTAVAWLAFQRDRAGAALSLWFAGVWVLCVFQPAFLANAALLTLPGYLLVGALAGNLAEGNAQPSPRLTLGTAAGLILLGMLLLVSMARFTRLGLWSGSQSSILALATLAFVLAGVAIVIAIAWDNPPARLGAFLGLVALLVYFQWGTGWQLSHFGSNDPRERWVVEGTDDDVYTLVDFLQSTSRQLAKSDDDLTVFSTIDTPVLRWYLRDFGTAQFGPALPVGATPPVVITPADAEPRLAEDYLGTDFTYAVRRTESPAQLTLTDVLRWWLFRESFAPLSVDRLVTWVRSDLLQP